VNIEKHKPLCFSVELFVLAFVGGRKLGMAPFGCAEPRGRVNDAPRSGGSFNGGTDGWAWNFKCFYSTSEHFGCRVWSLFVRGRLGWPQPAGVTLGIETRPRRPLLFLVPSHWTLNSQHNDIVHMITIIGIISITLLASWILMLAVQIMHRPWPFFPYLPFRCSMMQARHNCIFDEFVCF